MNKIKKSFSLVEILIAMMILIIFIVPIATISILSKEKIADFEDQKQLYNLAVAQIDANNKNIDTDGFDFENHHLNFNYLYVPGSSNRLAQYDRIGFLNDDPVLNLTFDGTQKIDDVYYVRDDKATIKGTLSVTASSTTTDTTGYETDFDDTSVIEKHLNEPQPYYIGSGDSCISGHCLLFYGNSTNEIASLVSFNNVIGWDQFNEVSFEFYFKLDEVREMEIVGKNNLSIGVASNSKPYFTSQFVTYEEEGTTTTNVMTTTTLPEPIFSTQTILGTTTLQADAWYHYVATYDYISEKLNIYLNGVLENSEAYSGDSDFSLISGDFSFGGTPTKAFKGVLDEAKVYDYALSSEEVKNHYNFYERNKGLLLYESFDRGFNSASYEVLPEIGDISSDGLLTGALFKLYNTNLSDHQQFGHAIDFNHTTGTVYPTYGILESSESSFNSKISTDEWSRIFDSDNITMEMWIRPTTIDNTKKGLISRGYESGGSYTISQEAYIQNGYLNFSVKTDQETNTLTGLTQLQADTWYLVSFSYDGQSQAIYINGLLDQETVTTGDLIGGPSGDTIFYLGYSGQNSEYFYGDIDELRIYNRGLSGDDIINRFKKAYSYYKNVHPVYQVEDSSKYFFQRNMLTGCVVTNDDTCSPISNPIAGIFHNPALLYTIDIARYGDGVDLDYLDFHQIITNHSSFGVLMYENVHWSKNSNYSGTVLNYKCDASSQRCFPRHDGQFTDLAECNSLCAASQSAEPPYTCSGSQCVIADPQPGQYSTVEECVTACDIAPPAGANACTNFYYSDDNKVCQSENISFGDSISLNNVGLSGYMISQTFDFEKPTSILAYSLEGEFDPALVKIQFDCKDDIVDASGVMISDEAWLYTGSSDYETCSISSFYSIALENFGGAGNAKFHPIKSCWRTYEREPSFCKFMRFKLILEPGAGSISKVVFRIAQQ